MGEALPVEAAEVRGVWCRWCWLGCWAGGEGIALRMDRCCGAVDVQVHGCGGLEEAFVQVEYGVYSRADL